MVFFNCNGCGEALKKNQVDKHALRCRQCQVLSCVDCGKDFWGNDYQGHTKCMTEDEKYCGKSYVPKVNKGEVKQEQWTEKVQTAIEKSATNPKLKGVLERLKDYPNIPRKKMKFENFLKNSVRVGNPTLISQVWDLLMAAAGQNSDVKDGISEKTNSLNGTSALETDKNTCDNSEDTKQHENGVVQDPDQKLSKRQRKEERRRKANKKEKKDKSIDNGEAEEGHRKAKKRKHADQDEEMHGETPSDVLDTHLKSDVQPSDKKQKKKKKKNINGDGEERASIGGSTDIATSQLDDSQDQETQVESSTKKKKKKPKFNWEATILSVLKSKGEISKKKLCKKVLNEFDAQDAANYSMENLRAKFEKKINRIAQVKVHKDKVTLK